MFITDRGLQETRSSAVKSEDESFREAQDDILQMIQHNPWNTSNNSIKRLSMRVWVVSMIPIEWLKLNHHLIKLYHHCSLLSDNIDSLVLLQIWWFVEYIYYMIGTRISF